MSPIRFVAAALLSLPVAVLSNDTMVTLGAGGLVPVKSSAVSMESEELTVSVRQITVKYTFRNRTTADVDAIVAFPLPVLNGGDVEYRPMAIPSKDPVNFVNFEVSVDGKPVRVNTDSRAFDEKRDVTKRIQSLGLPISVVDQRFKDVVAKLSIQQRTSLQKDELIGCEETPQKERRCWPLWETRTQFYWTQHFPAGKTIAVRHTYRPFVGGSYITWSDDGTSSVQPFCGGKDALLQISQLKKRHPAKNGNDTMLYENRIQYILTTANNWKGPIGEFRLTVVADRPEDIVLTCTKGLRPVAPTRYEATWSDFHPDKELDLLVLTTRNNFSP